MSTQTISIQELKNDILKKVDTINDKETLKQVLAVLKSDSKDVKPKSFIPIEKHIDTILKEDEGLLRRLAE